MSRAEGTSRKGRKIVRAPATKFPHLQKRMRKPAAALMPKVKKGNRG